jgi:hypothetical protein
VNDYKIIFLVLSQVPLMIPGERSKSAEVTEPGRDSKAFYPNRLIICLNKTKQPFYNLFTTFYIVCESQDNLRKNSKKNFENLTLENTK